MILIIGLGNPGKKYKNTRHNIGFKVVDKFAEKKFFLAFKLSKKFRSLISEKGKTILALPQTFMNESGKAVKTLANFYKIKDKNLIIVHDDIDLPLGKIRISKNRGSAGHKGVESIIKEIGNKNFIRLRVGIYPEQGHRPVKKPKAEANRGAEAPPRLPRPNLAKDNAKFVLQKFGKEEKEIIKTVIEKSAEALKLLATKGLEKTMNKVNRQFNEANRKNYNRRSKLSKAS